MLPPEDDDEEEFNLPEKLPLYQKGREIMALTHQIVALIEEDDEVLTTLKEFMLLDAAQLTVKVAGAEAGDLYDIRMENAALIRKAGRELLTHCSSLQMFGFKDVHYCTLLRQAIDEYRLLFLEWVQGFDQWNFVPDRWGLFNPPGIPPEQPDEDDL